MQECIEGIDASARERSRAALIIQFYRLLWQKYRLGTHDLQGQLAMAAGMGLPSGDDLIAALQSDSIQVRLTAVLQYLDRLKEIILSPNALKPSKTLRESVISQLASPRCTAGISKKSSMPWP